MDIILPYSRCPEAGTALCVCTYYHLQQIYDPHAYLYSHTSSTVDCNREKRPTTLRVPILYVSPASGTVESHISTSNWLLVPHHEALSQPRQRCPYVHRVFRNCVQLRYCTIPNRNTQHYYFWRWVRKWGKFENSTFSAIQTLPLHFRLRSSRNKCLQYTSACL